MKHHEFSPSGLEQMRLCPGSYKMQLGIENEDNEYSIEGTMLHEAVATGNIEILNDEQLALYQTCYDFLAEQVQDGDKVFKEQKVVIKDKDGSILTEGTADVVIQHEDDSITVIDWKFGYNPVNEVNKNIQLASYAVGAMQKFAASSCNCWVYQPRIYAKSSYVFQNADAIIENIKLIIKRAKTESYVLNASEDACRYCRAQMDCPAFRDKFRQMVLADSDYDLTHEHNVERLYDASKVAKAMIKRIEDAMREIIVDKGSCGRYTIKETSGARQINDINQLYNVVKDYVTIDEFMSTCKLSITKLEALLSNKLIARADAMGEKMTKVKAKMECNELMSDLISYGTPKQRIVEIKE